MAKHEPPIEKFSLTRHHIPIALFGALSLLLLALGAAVIFMLPEQPRTDGAKIGSGPQSRLASNPFFIESFAAIKPFDELTLEDFPSYYNGVGEIATWGDTIYTNAASGFVLAYNRRGEVVGVSDRRLCEARGRPMVIGNKLYIACEKKGLYEIDLETNSIAYRYNIGSTSNLSYAIDGSTIWVGHLTGLSKVDLKNKTVTHINIPGVPEEYFNPWMEGDGDEIWFTDSASSYARGIAGRYDRTTETWTTYTAKDFPLGREGQSIDFYELNVTDGGVFALYDLRGFDGNDIMLAKFDSKQQRWVLMKRGAFNEMRSELPRPEPRYANFSQHGRFQLRLLADEQWTIIPIDGRRYYALSRQVGDAYYLLSSAGLEVYRLDDERPKVIGGLQRINLTYEATNAVLVSDDEQLVIGFDMQFTLGPTSDYRFDIYRPGDGSMRSTEIESYEHRIPKDVGEVAIAKLTNGAYAIRYDGTDQFIIAQDGSVNATFHTAPPPLWKPDEAKSCVQPKPTAAKDIEGWKVFTRSAMRYPSSWTQYGETAGGMWAAYPFFDHAEVTEACSYRMDAECGWVATVTSGGFPYEAPSPEMLAQPWDCYIVDGAYGYKTTTIREGNRIISVWFPSAGFNLDVRDDGSQSQKIFEQILGTLNFTP